jgi:hypothetical protein
MTGRKDQAAAYRSPARRAVEAHTNLNTFAAVVKLLEDGCLYGPHAEAAQIIAIAKRAQARLLREYDRSMAAALELRS